MASDRRKKEAVDALLNELASGSSEQVPVCLRTALERGWNEELPTYIDAAEAAKREDVSHICKRHYDEFLESVQDLLSVSGDADALLGTAQALSNGLDATGAAALEKIQALAQLRHAQKNLSAASQTVDECLKILRMLDHADAAIESGRYYPALTTIDTVERLLHGDLGADGEGRAHDTPRLRLVGAQGGKNAFTERCDRWIATLRQRITHKGMVGVSHWLLQVRPTALPVGRAAMRRMAQHLLFSRGVAHPIDDEAGAEGSGNLLLSGVLALSKALAYDRWGHLGWLPECVMPGLSPAAGGGGGAGGGGAGGGGEKNVAPNFSNAGLARTGAGEQEARRHARQEDDMLDGVGEKLQSVHVALLIHAHFQRLPAFCAYYAANRLPQGELEAMNTTDLRGVSPDAFFEVLPDVLCGLCGFYLVESALLAAVDQPEGLPPRARYRDLWDDCRDRLIGLVRRNLPRAAAFRANPSAHVALKELLCCAARTLSDVTRGLLDLEARQVVAFVADEGRRAFDAAQERWISAELEEILGDEVWQPLYVADDYDFKRLVEPLDLHTVKPLLDIERSGGATSAALEKSTKALNADAPAADGADRAAPSLRPEAPSPAGPMAAFLAEEGDLAGGEASGSDDPILRAVGAMLSASGGGDGGGGGGGGGVTRAASIASADSGATAERDYPVTLPFSAAFCKVARLLHRSILHCALFSAGLHPPPGADDAGVGVGAADAGAGGEAGGEEGDAALDEAARSCHWLAGSVEGALVLADAALRRAMEKSAADGAAVPISKSCQVYVDAVNMALLPDRLSPIVSDAFVMLLGRAQATAGAAAAHMDAALARLGARSRQLLEATAQRARDMVSEALRAELGELMGGLRSRSQFGERLWVAAECNSGPRSWLEDVVNFLRITFMTKLTYLPLDAREALHYLTCVYINQVLLECLVEESTTPAQLNVTGLYNLRLDVEALQRFADETGVLGLRDCLAEVYEILAFLTSPHLEGLIADPAGRAYQYPRVSADKAAAVLMKIHGHALINQTGGPDLPQLDRRTAQSLARMLSGQD